MLWVAVAAWALVAATFLARLARHPGEPTPGGPDLWSGPVAGGTDEMTVTPDPAAKVARAAEAFMSRHAELQAVLDHWAGVLAAAADSGRPVRPVRNLLRAVLADEVLPQARAEERTLYRSARRDPAVSLLVQVLISEHQVLASIAGRLGEPTPPAATAAAISALFASHVAKEDSPAAARAGTFWYRPGRALARGPCLAGGQCAA
jgi:hypothetical protein